MQSPDDDAPVPPAPMGAGTSAPDESSGSSSSAPVGAPTIDSATRDESISSSSPASIDSASLDESPPSSAAVGVRDGDRFDISMDVLAAAQNRYVRSPLAPAQIVLPAFIEADEADFRATQQLLINPPPTRQKTRLLVFSLLAFLGAALIARGTSSLVDLALLVGVILFHELGHMAGMIVFGYRDVRIFFIPFLGGAASGRKRGVERWKESCVLLLGPLPGIIAGCIIARTGGAAAQSGWVHTLTLQLLVVNALNLLPIAPLDGGQLFSVLIFSRDRHLEIVFTAVTGALLGVIGIVTGLWVLAIIAWFVLFSLRYRKRIFDAGAQLRDTGLPSDPARLTEVQQRRVWRAMWDRLPDTIRTRWRGRPVLQARAMEEIVDRATLEPPGAETTIALLAVWFFSLAVAGVGVAPLAGGGAAGSSAHWTKVRNASPHFTVELPSEARRIDGPVTLIEAGDCRLVFQAVEQADGWLAGAAPSSNKPLRETSHDREVHEGNEYKRAVLNNGEGFVLSGKGDVGKRFVESFHLLE